MIGDPFADGADHAILMVFATSSIVVVGVGGVSGAYAATKYKGVL